MFGLKGKTLLFFVITTLLLAGVGVYFFVSINTLKKKVESRFEPKEQTSLLKSLTLDINNLNNQYLNDTLELSDSYIDSIIESVEESINKIQLESKKLRFSKNDNLDTIPKMLYELKQKNFELKDLRKSGENDFVFSLEKAIQDEFKNKLLSEKDSIIVTHQITSYIKENKIFNDQPKTELDDDEDERSFFQRLFKSKDKKPQDELPQEEETRSVPVIEIDTTVQQITDTINQLNVDGSGIDLLMLFDEIQRKRIRYINNIQGVEKEIYELNYNINKNIEGIINDFILQQYASYENNLAELKVETGTQATILLVTILGFTLFAIVLIFRFFKDINRSLEYQNTLKLKEVQAKRENEEKQRFLNTMSHEIRTPLTSIIGYVDLLKGDSKSIRAIKSSANYLYQMTNEILDIAKINIGVIEIKKEVLDLTKMLNDIKNNFIPHIEGKGLEYMFDIPDYPIYVYTDGQRIQQILYNLIHNAIKFTDEGSVTLKVEVQELEGTYQVVFRIIDSGIGMNKREQVQVFEDFHQAGTHKSKLKGTGLGLGIVKKLVELLSGDLQLSSESGKGTTFVLSFTLDKANSDELYGLGKNESSIEEYLNVFYNKKIIIVDDDVLITSLYEKMLAPTNAEVYVFNNPQKAFEFALDIDFDLLIIDYRMPEMSGYQFLKSLIVQKEILPKTIVSTANAMLDDETRTALNAFDKVVFKPIKRNFFLNQIAEVLEVQVIQPLENDHEVVSNKTLDLKALRNYVGDETEDLIEILEVIVEENDKSLRDLKKAIEDSNQEGIAFVIHQLSSRFSQVDASLTIRTEKIENDLRDPFKQLSLEPIISLYEEWMRSQSIIQNKLLNLKEDL